MCWQAIIPIAKSLFTAKNITAAATVAQAGISAKRAADTAKFQNATIAQQNQAMAEEKKAATSQQKAIEDEQKRQADLMAEEKRKAEKLIADRASAAQSEGAGLLASSLQKKIRRTGTSRRRSLFTGAGGGAGYFSRFG